MKSSRSFAVVTILFLVTLVYAAAGPSPTGAPPEAALVVVCSRTFTGLLTGNGFIVGDGTQVVTCEHIVFEKSESGKHRVEAFVGVYSPHLGQACDAQILAADEELDLAVLEVPWKGHPSLFLADTNAVLSARRGRVIGLSATVHRIGKWDEGPSEVESFRVDGEERPLAFVAVRKNDPRVVALDGIGQLGYGWSGSPILVPGTCTAIGCFASINKTLVGSSTAREEARGPAVSQVPRLLGVRPDDRRFHPARTQLESPDDAHVACSLSLQTASLLQPGTYEAALEPARAFVQRRPNCAAGHKVLAYVSEHVGQGGAAREEYRRAMELDPNGLNARLLYAQFLGNHGEPNAAMQILEPLWQSGRSHDLVGIAMVNLLGEKKDFVRCFAILDEALKVNPRSAHLWQQMAGCRMQAQGPAAAIEPVTRAMELCPERGPLRAHLAQLLEMTGALDEAEKHFRKLLEMEPENPVVYFWLSEFLSKHRPRTGEEALTIAEKALNLPARGSLPREKIEELVKRIREQKQSTGHE